jgi:hypothetical protein
MRHTIRAKNQSAWGARSCVSFAAGWSLRTALAFILLCSVASAQQQQSSTSGDSSQGTSSQGTSSQGIPAPQAAQPHSIQDNSFLVEEAYNQEYGVVQHISNFTRLWPSGQWAYTFTQEWPVNPRPRHQLSYTIPIVNAGGSSGTGIGDIGLNYRYQVLGNGAARVAFAPRFSLFLPSGNYRLGRGAGGLGLQGSLPLSIVVTKKLVTHWNAGTTIVPRARNPIDQKGATFGYNLGQSFIWLMHPRVNLMLETVWNSSEVVVSPGNKARVNTLLLSPGVRWAQNFNSGLQIVYGVATPIGLGPSAGEKGVFLYLSFEHPFTKLRQN